MVMALYLSRSKFTLMGSGNLRQWRRLSDVAFPDGHECPELFAMPVDGDPGRTRWVMWEAGGRHMIGQFDGEKFTPETAVLPSEWGSNCYAGQTWNGVPDGRRLFIAWMNARAGRNAPAVIYPDMPFNQQMTFPREFSLRATPDGIRLFAQPTREIEKLHGRRHRWSNLPLTAGKNPLSGIDGELFDIDARIAVRKAKSITLDVRGTPIRYDTAGHELTCLGKSVRFAPAGDRLDLQVLVDRTSIEIFAADGRYVMSFCFKPDAANRELALTVEGGAAAVKSLDVWELKPALPVASDP